MTPRLKCSDAVRTSGRGTGMLASSVVFSAGTGASGSEVANSAAGLRYSNGAACALVGGAFTTSPIAAGVSGVESGLGAGPIDLREGVLSMTGDAWIAEVWIEDVSANRCGEKVCLERTALLCGDAPNIRGTGFAAKAR